MRVVTNRIGASLEVVLVGSETMNVYYRNMSHDQALYNWADDSRPTQASFGE